MIPLKLLVWEGYLLFHVPDMQETLGFLTTLFVVNLQGICLILHCFVIVDRCLLQLVKEYLFELSGNATEYESNFHIYFGRIVLSKSSQQSIRPSAFVKSSVQL